jgi:hypothetical protein
MKTITIPLATALAESQHDLGGISKKRMIRALTDPDDNNRLQAFGSLDPISQLIVASIHSSEDLDEALSTLNYTLNCLIEAHRVINNEINQTT